MREISMVGLGISVIALIVSVCMHSLLNVVIWSVDCVLWGYVLSRIKK